jgi:hypothetical protein
MYALRISDCSDSWRFFAVFLLAAFIAIAQQEKTVIKNAHIAVFFDCTYV